MGKADTCANTPSACAAYGLAANSLKEKCRTRSTNVYFVVAQLSPIVRATATI